MEILFVVLGIAAWVAVALVLVFAFRTHRFRFRRTRDKEAQLATLNKDLAPFGFAYEPPPGDHFYSLMNCWQRRVGYCRLYDEAAPLFNMVMDCEPIAFSYAGKRWLIELWKGQYGISTGGEIGIYNTSREDVHTEKFTGPFYEAAGDEERLPLSFVLRKNRKVLLRRTAVHWWLTGFLPGKFSQPEELTMDARLRFPNSEMCLAFVNGLLRAGYTRQEFSVVRTTVRLRYARPHAPQPESREGLSRAVVQKANETYCLLFEAATEEYPDTLDKLEYCKAIMPELYHFLFRSLYSTAFFSHFSRLLDLVHGGGSASSPSRPSIPEDFPCLR